MKITLPGLTSDEATTGAALVAAGAALGTAVGAAFGAAFVGPAPLGAAVAAGTAVAAGAAGTAVATGPGVAVAEEPQAINAKSAVTSMNLNICFGVANPRMSMMPPSNSVKF